MDLGGGMRIGPWRIERELGRGGMGMVLEAEHETTHARAALKIVAGELASDPRFRERFLLEAKLAASVSHPNVVACLDSGVDQGRLYLALELAPGGSLADRVREGPLPWREVARLGAQIARALEAIHGAGIVHRDLKPANVLVDIYGSVKLTDFGLARGVEVSGLTRTGELLGTVEYMAPEQSDNARTVDGRADLYALGCTLHCLSFGQPPFPGSGPQVILKHLRDAPAPLPRPRCEPARPTLPWRSSASSSRSSPRTPPGVRPAPARSPPSSSGSLARRTRGARPRWSSWPR
jgi:serine/threonine-protein kinase